MAQDLWVQPFSDSLLGCVQDFCCGDQPWEVEVSDWIKDEVSDDGAIKKMRQRGTEVWLYRTGDVDGDVAGYGSLGKTQWKWPAPNGPKKTISIIPFFGVASAFQGKPSGAPPEERYAYKIMSDLISKASSHGTTILGLWVHKLNVRARNFYERVGFQCVQDDGKSLIRMYLDLSGIAADHPVA